MEITPNLARRLLVLGAPLLSIGLVTLSGCRQRRAGRIVRGGCPGAGEGGVYLRLCARSTWSGSGATW